ncbi:proteasome subunit beta [Nitzschia inconspicua]|uniref:Proteasome subunit beta n=1 Tax=Nitzschia inconspicua TaxID=303405 RepID=A0A9K3LY41_9STRA|nr:proteasome subunit beta [Nitzschia inconspicua]
MGVPKFFRWISERYPKINQRHGSPPNPKTIDRYFDQAPNLEALETPDPLSTCGLPPEIDRLYLDMNGIIHGCSHNNSDQKSGLGDVAGQEEPTDGANGSKSSGGTYQISNEEIFRNVCYYLDRIIGDMVQPKELVYMAIDGVAPRAKMNQQRSRRYRSGREGEIETNIYEAHALTLKEEEIMLQRDQEEEVAVEQQFGRTKRDGEDAFNFVLDVEEGNTQATDSEMDSFSTQFSTSDKIPSNFGSSTTIEEIAPGRFKGKFETHLEEERMDDQAFHSNAITPGTPFFTEFTRHLEHFVKFKLSSDPKWKDLTIIFSGPNVPGEGEHKIMQFIREQRSRPDYNPNLRHCIMGQDGDLIMLGLCTHEPNLLLLRERVIFNSMQQRLEEVKVESMLDSYIHNSHFEYLHMSVLRDYLAYEFETSNVISDSPWDLERTIDDFVFMTFLVGNDFLPHLPAIDIADNAFDLLFWTYKKCRLRWAKEKFRENADGNMPYLTHAGKILSGRRLEEYLAAVGSHENSYYDKKRQTAETESKRLRKQYKRMGMENSHIPDDSLVASKEASDRAAYRKMLENMGDSAIESHETSREKFDSFQPVMTRKVEFEPIEDEIEEGLIARMGSLLQNSLSSSTDGRNEDATKYQLVSIDDQDLKGRYYYDKFQFTPFDADKHLALRRAYIEGLVWNLSYYYEGCISWEWYYPYHYGPMLSDLVNLDEILEDISFDDKGAPLAPFEQLLGCMPASQAHHLPVPYRWLMTDERSPIIDFYPQTFTVDMNGKRWPWEAVVLLPFIDSKRLLEATATVDQSLLTDEERKRNAEGQAVVMVHNTAHQEVVAGIGSLGCFKEIEACRAVSVPLEMTDWSTPEVSTTLQPVIKEGTKHPLPGFGSLQTAPVQSLWRRKMGLNIFGGRSRYKTATLEVSSLMPPLPPVAFLGPKLIGTTVFINYPHYIEALVTAVSDQKITVRGKKEPRKWTQEEESRWKFQRDGMIRQAEIGEGRTGTGGLVLPSEEVITLSVRPMKGLSTMNDGTLVKTYAKFEIEIPLISTFWGPSNLDPRLCNVPSRLEKNPYEVALNDRAVSRSRTNSKSAKGEYTGTKKRKLFPSKKRPFKERFRTGNGGMNGRSKISTALFSTNCVDISDFRQPIFSLSYNLTGLHPRLRCATFYSTFFQASHFGKPSGEFLLLQSPRITPVKAIKTRLRPQFAQPLRPAVPKSRLLSAAVVAFSFLFGIAESSRELFDRDRLCSLKRPKSHYMSWSISLFDIRGGDIETEGDNSVWPIRRPTPNLEFAHGTTTLSFSFQGGIVVAVDSRASLGSFVGSKTVQKVLPISTHVLGTMAGGAADCQHWIRKVKADALLYELKEDGKRMSVSRVSRILSNCLYNTRHWQLSVGTMIAGWDSKGPQIFYVDNSGLRIQGDLFAVGSGSTFALGILDSETDRHKLSIDEAVALGIKAIRHATFRDAYSGGFINVYLITPEDGWKKVYTEDIARSPEIWMDRSDPNTSGVVTRHE